jgi:hypothetical protein
MRIGYKEYYNSAETTKVLHVSLLKIICVDPEFLEPPHDLARWQKGDKFDEFTNEYLFNIYSDNYGGQATQLYYHTDFLSTSYRYTEEYEHEISEDLKKTALEDDGILLQTVWDITIFDCSFEIGTSAEQLANSVLWQLNRGGDLLTKIFSAKFSSSFFTKCAILSEIWTNHAGDENLAEFIEYNDAGLPLAHSVHIAEKMSDFDEEDFDDFDYIEETWVQLCETLGIDKDGDYTTYKDMLVDRKSSS